MKKTGRRHWDATESPYPSQHSLFPELSENGEKWENQKPAVKGGRPAKNRLRGVKPEDNDELLLSMLAKVLVEVSNRIQKTGSLHFPFPRLLVLLWHYFAVENLWKQRGLPTTFQEFWLWAHRPVADLGLVLPPEVDPAETLLDSGLPTMLCHDLLMEEEDPEAQESQELIRQVRLYCDEQKETGQSAYVAFRRLLITHPVLTRKQWEDYSDTPDLALMTPYVLKAYESAPRSAAPDGFFEICPYCQDLCLPTVDTQWRMCSEPGCRQRNAARLARERPLRVKGEVWWLRPGLRRYVSAPGQAEIRLAETFQKMNIATELWPRLDTYDLRLCFPDGEVWAIDVKDWRSPSRLAKKLNGMASPPGFPRWDRWFWVFPDHRKTENKNWLSVFCREYQHLSSTIRAAFEKDIIEQARRKLRDGQMATAVGQTDRLSSQ